MKKMEGRLKLERKGEKRRNRFLKRKTWKEN